MIRPTRKTLVKYLSAVVIAGLGCLAFLCLQAGNYGPLSQRGYIDQYKVLCDAFSLPGLLMIFIGMLVAVVNAGALDGLGYVGHYVFNSLITARRSNILRYSEYLELKRGKKVSGFGFLFVIGAVFLLIGLVFYYLYKSAL